jgi:hypothetical protein
MLPDAPGLFSMMTGWPSILDKGSASVRAAISGVEPPGKPTRIRTGLVGHTATGSDLFDSFWAVAIMGMAHAAINNVANENLADGVLNNRTRFFMAWSFNHKGFI